MMTYHLRSLVLVLQSRWISLTHRQRLSAAPTQREELGIKVTGRGIIREECDVYRDGEKIGYITSGTFLPYLNGSYGMAIVESAKREIVAHVQVDVRGRKLMQRQASFLQERTVTLSVICKMIFYEAN